MALVLAPATLGRGDSVSSSAVDTSRRDLKRDKKKLLRVTVSGNQEVKDSQSGGEIFRLLGMRGKLDKRLRGR